MNSIYADICFSVMFVLVPFIALALLPHAGISLRRLSIPSFIIIFYLVSAYIGILPLYFQWTSYPVTIGVVDREIILKMFIYSSSVLIIMICGFIYAHRVIGFNVNVIRNRVLVSANTSQRMLIFCLALLCGLVFVTYIRKLETIALFEALNGEIFGAAVARSNMGNAFRGKYWRYEIFFRQLLDYCVIFFMADYLIKRRPLSGFIFLASFVVATFSATIAIQKAPFLRLLIMLYLTYVIYKGGNYWQRVAKYFVIMILGILSLFYIYFMGVSDILSALELVIGRIFIGQILAAYFYLDLFPHHLDYLLGASFPNPGGLLPFQSFPLTVEVSNFISPGQVAKGVVGSASTVFWAEMYANFGPIGVIFSSFLVGIGLFAVSHVLSKLPLSPPTFAVTIALAMHYRDLTETSLSNYFFDMRLLLIIIITFMVLMLRKRISIRRNIQFTQTSEVRLHAK